MKKLNYKVINACLLFVFSLFFYVPAILYSTNSDEFTAGYLNITKHFLIPAAGLAAVLICLVLISPQIIKKRLTSLLIIFSLLIYIQSSFLAWDYGLLDGQDIDWSVHGS